MLLCLQKAHYRATHMVKDRGFSERSILNPGAFSMELDKSLNMTPALKPPGNRENNVSAWLIRLKPPGLAICSVSDF